MHSRGNKVRSRPARLAALQRFRSDPAQTGGGASREVAETWLAWCVLVARASRRRRGVPLRDARRELGLVHRAEQAELLREASELMIGASPSRSPLLGPAPTAARLRGFRRRLAEELVLAETDGVLVPRELELLGRETRWRWVPQCGASATARAALALQPRPAERLTLARAWLAEGRGGRACAELVLLARSPMSPAIVRGVELCRAALLESRGDLAGAERRLVRSLAPEDSYYRAVALALALACGDASTARGLAAELAAGPDGRAAAAEARAAAVRVRARIPHWRRAGARWTDGCARLVFELLCGEGDPAARVALALIG